VKTAYRVYGLTVTSSVEIHALRSARLNNVANPDAHFEIGAPRPAWAAEALELRAKRLPTTRPATTGPDSFQVTEHGEGQFFQLAYGDGTRFLVDHQATRIWGESGPGLTDGDVLVYLLGPVLGFVLRRRAQTPLHASSLAIGNHAVALVGMPGAGKSTTAAALALRGWPVLCEDVCALKEINGETHVLPGYPRICLWPESVNMLYASPDALPLIVAGWSKRYLPLDGGRCKFSTKSLPLRAIYFLAARSEDAAAPYLEPVTQRAAVPLLAHNTYMNYLLSREQRAAEFDAITNLVSRVESLQITPSSNPERLGEMASLIECDALRRSSVASSLPGRYGG
jgi:hypothetical protein